VPSQSQQPTVLFSIYQNNTFTRHGWDNRPRDPAYHIEDCRIPKRVYLWRLSFLGTYTTCCQIMVPLESMNHDGHRFARWEIHGLGGWP
jgi:hypothetical protein